MDTLEEYQKKAVLFHALDDFFKTLIPDKNYKELNLGSIISKEELEKCGYFDKNPDYLLLNASIHEKDVEKVLKTKQVESSVIDDNTISFLIPAGCLNIYPLFKNRTDIENVCISNCSRVFRRENTYTEGVRLKEFTQREIVFIGEQEYVRSMLDKFAENIFLFAQRINNQARIEAATDHFYATPMNRLAKRYQLINNTKREVIIPINGNDVACSSINYHNNSFSKAFNFACNNRIVTGCVGFGVERWCSAFESNSCDRSILNDLI